MTSQNVPLVHHTIPQNEDKCKLKHTAKNLYLEIGHWAIELGGGGEAASRWREQPKKPKSRLDSTVHFQK